MVKILRPMWVIIITAHNWFVLAFSVVDTKNASKLLPRSFSRFKEMFLQLKSVQSRIKRNETKQLQLKKRAFDENKLFANTSTIQDEKSTKLKTPFSRYVQIFSLILIMEIHLSSISLSLIKYDFLLFVKHAIFWNSCVWSFDTDIQTISCSCLESHFEKTTTDCGQSLNNFNLNAHFVL